MTNDLTRSVTPKPRSMDESELLRRAKLEGRQVVVCYGGEEGFKIANILKKRNPESWINFIVAPTDIPFGDIPPKEGVLEKEIKESHCIVVLFDKNGFFKRKTAKMEFWIILGHRRSKYIPIFLKTDEKEQIIEMVKEEFEVDLKKEKQYVVWKEPNKIPENLYESIIKKVIIP